jgi:hypothetical protein
MQYLFVDLRLLQDGVSLCMFFAVLEPRLIQQELHSSMYTAATA